MKRLIIAAAFFLTFTFMTACGSNGSAEVINTGNSPAPAASAAPAKDDTQEESLVVESREPVESNTQVLISKEYEYGESRMLVGTVLFKDTSKIFTDISFICDEPGREDTQACFNAIYEVFNNLKGKTNICAVITEGGDSTMLLADEGEESITSTDQGNIYEGLPERLTVKKPQDFKPEQKVLYDKVDEDLKDYTALLEQFTSGEGK